MEAVGALNLKPSDLCLGSLSFPRYQFPYADDLRRAFTHPDDASLASAQVVLDQARADSERVSAMMERLMVTLDQLEEYQDALRDHIEACEVFVLPSPIRVLPPEILELVFTFAGCGSRRQGPSVDWWLLALLLRGARPGTLRRPLGELLVLARRGRARECATQRLAVRSSRMTRFGRDDAFGYQ